MNNNLPFQDFATATVRRGSKTEDSLGFRGWVKTVCRGPDGDIKWVDEGKNFVCNEGIDYILGTAILDSATLYVGLLGAGTPAAAWTMTEAGGSTGAPSDTNGDREIHGEYSEATRPAWGQDAAASQAVSNSTAVSFSINGTATVTGAFLSTVNTKNNQTGTLVAAKLFTGGNKAVSNGDTLEVTYTITGSSS